MSAGDVTVADQLLEAVKRDDREAVYGLFSDDIEYVTDRGSAASTSCVRSSIGAIRRRTSTLRS